VVEAADFGKLHDLPRRGTLDRPEVGCVLVEREMCTRLMVIGEVASQDVAEVVARRGRTRDSDTRAGPNR
jgi:hypothetical protein